MQFFIRNNSLLLFVKMRSSDVWFGLPYDVPFFVWIQYRMWWELKKKLPDLRLGTYHHQSGSLHLYGRNMEKVDGILSKPFSVVPHEYAKLFTDLIGFSAVKFIPPHKEDIYEE